MRPGQLTSFCATLPVADCREGKVSCKRKIPPAHVMLQPQQRQQRRGDLRFLATIPLSRVLTGRRMAGGGGGGGAVGGRRAAAEDGGEGAERSPLETRVNHPPTFEACLRPSAGRVGHAVPVPVFILLRTAGQTTGLGRVRSPGQQRRWQAC